MLNKILKVSNKITLLNSNRPNELNVFVNYSGHVETIRISVFYNGWGEDVKEDLHTSLRLCNELEVYKSYIKICKLYKKIKKNLKTPRHF